MSDLFVDNIKHQSSQGSGTITLGTSGEKITTASGAEFNAVTGHMYPAFEAVMSENQSVTDNADTKRQFDTEIFDTDGAYDATTNYRFTVPSGKAGKYFIYTVQTFSSDTNSTIALVYAYIYKNGSAVRVNHMNFTSNYTRSADLSISVVLDLAEGDYIEAYGRLNVTSGSPKFQSEVGAGKISSFGGFRIGA